MYFTSYNVIIFVFSSSSCHFTPIRVNLFLFFCFFQTLASSRTSISYRTSTPSSVIIWLKIIPFNQFNPRFTFSSPNRGADRKWTRPGHVTASKQMALNRFLFLFLSPVELLITMSITRGVYWAESGDTIRNRIRAQWHGFSSGGLGDSSLPLHDACSVLSTIKYTLLPPEKFDFYLILKLKYC